MTEPILHSVSKVKATQLDNVYVLTVDITDMYGERYVCDYASYPDDTFGLNPKIREWIDENISTFNVIPYAPATPEELRKGMPNLSRRQFFLSLAKNGIDPDSIYSAILSLPDETDKLIAKIEWETTQSFSRMSETLNSIASLVNISQERIDELWEFGLTL